MLKASSTPNKKSKKREDVNILWFSEVGKEDTAVVGGKGANLGELTNAGLPVPNGFIVTAQAYFNFLEEAGLKEKIKKELEGLDPESTKDLQARALKVQKIIKKAEMPKSLKKEIIKNYKKLSGGKKTYVAVRSSATAEDLADASFAGQQATFLNVLGDENVIQAVEDCWASLFEARAIYYREDKGFDQLEVGIAVPIQKMVASEKAGVMFTIDPTNNDMDHIAIEAAYGLGEVVVLGAQTPDRYLVDKKTLKITDKDIHKQTWMLTRESGSSDTADLSKMEQNSTPVPKKKQETQKLSDKEILGLTKLAIEIEDHYKKPQDTEWGIEGGKIYMLQSRPVTTLGDSGAKETQQAQNTEKAKVILRGSAASTGIAQGTVQIIHSPEEIDQIKEGDVLVTEMTTPDYVPAMKRANAIITDEGGRTCHAAIVSRELGIPCVVGTESATKDLKNGQMVTVDGKNGLIYDGVLEQKEERKPLTEYQVKAPAPVTATRIYVNLGEPELADKIAEKEVDGVGLLRAEFIISESIGEHPKKMIKEKRGQEFVDKLAEGLEKFARAFHPRPVVYRATDFKTNEYRNLKGGAEFEPEEENPMIGYRGCFRYLKDPDVFNLELEAIKKVRKNYDNLHLMIPFVRRVDEFKQVKDLVEKAGLSAKKDPDFKLWIMVEVPSAVILIDQLCDLGIDGVSIGSNDLTQLTLGLDRDSSIVAEEFDERNEAVQWMLKRTIEVCREKGVTASICGQAPSVYPEICERLVEYGVTSISVNPDVIDSTRRLVASVEEKLLLKELKEVKQDIADIEKKLEEEKQE